MQEIDYSVYLVTARDLLPPGKSYLESLEEALQGGVTVVQVREKKTDTGEFVEIARQSKELCDKYGVPLIINDRVDVALAVGAAGVHLGQDDMDLNLARLLLPAGTVIGISCNTPEQVAAAVKGGADYVGIGAVWGTKTKDLTSPVIGVRGVGERLKELDGTSVKAVAIGGIKSSNLWRTLHGSVSVTGHSLDGIAVVSEIVASQNPRSAAAALAFVVDAFKTEQLRLSHLIESRSLTKSSIIGDVATLIRKIRHINPLIHQITNIVVTTQSANITLAVGASPIMATEPLEMEDMTRICGALLVNMGSVTRGAMEGARLAGQYANKFRKPIVFDPVGVGASAFRKESVKEILDSCQVSVIKGNAGELAALAGTEEVQSKGVDSVGPGFKDPVSFVRALAKRERCVVVLTGQVDYISDGTSVVALANGDPVLGRITGSGCMLGSCIAAYCAAAVSGIEVHEQGRLVEDSIFVGAIAGVLVMTVATELAVKRKEVRGPGTFLPGLIDTLWGLSAEDVRSHANISIY